MTLLSVIIPTLDEAAALPLLLSQLKKQEGIALEIIVADGGSRDDTAAIAQREGAQWVAAARGRGAQMNAGATVAHGKYLLFLHADSQLVSTQQLRDAVQALDANVRPTGARRAGHFPLRFARSRAEHDFFFRMLEHKSATNRPGTINGDQGLLIGADYFRELGGFDSSLPFLEDQRIAEKIRATGRWLLLPGLLVTSARRFETEGTFRRYTLMALIMGMHAADAREFFARAPRIYAAQTETGRLRMGAYLGLTWRVLIDAGFAGAARILWRAGRYTRQNSWQPFLWWDVLRNTKSGLNFHDRFVHPIIDNVIADALSTVLMSAWFLLVLPLAYFLVDGYAPQRALTGDPAG